MGVLPCVEWLGTRTSAGYGQVRVEGRRIYAHRWVWELVNGRALEPSEEVRHSCDNPSCVNPDHLLVGSHADNMRDMKERGRANGGSAWSVTPTCKNGHPWTEENTYRPPKRPHHRHCRACNQASSRRGGQ